MLSRSKKDVIFTKHFIEKAIFKGIFDDCGFENGKKMTEFALKHDGIIVDDKCIFELPNKKLVTVPFVYESNNIIAKTIFFSQKPDIEEYAKKFKSRETNIG